MKCNGAVADSRRVREYWSLEIWIIRKIALLHPYIIIIILIDASLREKLILMNTAKFEGKIRQERIKLWKSWTEFLLVPLAERERVKLSLDFIAFYHLHGRVQWREKFNTGPFRKAGKRGGWWIIECSRESVNSRASRYVGAADDTMWPARWFKKNLENGEEARACILPSRCPEQVKRYLYPAGRTIR